MGPDLRRDERIRTRLEELPPSSKFVYTVLEYNGHLSQKELVEETMLASRTVRYALKQLEEANLVESHTALHDARQTCYTPVSSVGTDTEYANHVLVESDWVADNLEAFQDDESDVRLVQVPTVDDEGRQIPGSIRLQEISRSDRRGVPDRHRLAAALGERGIDSGTSIVLYSDDNNRRAAYAYWVLSYYGHQALYLLNGGFDVWKASGRAVVSEGPSLAPREYDTSGTIEPIRAYRDDVVRALTQDTTIVDVRNPSEQRCEDASEDTTVVQPEGVIPGSINVPWLELFCDDGRFRERSELDRLCEERGISPDNRVIVYCSVGERSALAWFALRELLGYSNVMNYDGSWIEWGNLVDVPIEREP